MKRKAQIKELLILNAIHLIAEGGFEKATTKELAHCRGHLPDLKMNEAYVYRIFGNKEKLYEAAFLSLDAELCEVLKSAIRRMKEYDGSMQEKIYELFIMIWQFLMKNEEHFRCYVRYYYSVYFKGSSLKAHEVMVRRIADETRYVFKEEADVYSILHSVFLALIDFAIRVYNGDLEDNEINRPHIFNVLYCMMMTYLEEDNHGTQISVKAV